MYVNDFIGLIKIINCRHFELLPMHLAHHPIEAFGKHPLKCQMNVWLGSDYVSSLCETKMLKCFALVWHYFDNTHVKTYAIRFNVVFFFVCLFCLFVNSEHLQLYGYIWCVINWQSVWLEYCWHAVNLDEQTLDTGVLRKKNYSLFLECTCTFDMNNCYMYLFLLRKKKKKNKV